MDASNKTITQPTNNDIDGRKVLDLVSMMGSTLLQNGAEIVRVQTTMDLVAEAYGKEDIEVYALSNGIFATLRNDDKTGCTQIKNVPLSSANLGRVAMINQLSREICEHRYSIDEALDKMHAILEAPGIPLWLKLAAGAVGCAGYCFLYGGSFLDFLATMPIGILIALFQHFMQRTQLSKVMQTIIGSAIITLSGLIMATIFKGLNLDMIVTGGLIILVPGVPFTTSIRDFFNGDYLSGTIRLIDALLVAFCMAVGVGFIYQIFM